MLPFGEHFLIMALSVIAYGDATSPKGRGKNLAPLWGSWHGEAATERAKRRKL